MFGIGMTELLVILAIGLLVLGPKRLPELAGSLGKGLAELRRSSREARQEFLTASSHEAEPVATPSTTELAADMGVAGEGAPRG